jgi:hypothetical protein
VRQHLPHLSLVLSDSSKLPSLTDIPQNGEDEVEYAHLVTGDGMMKIIAALIVGLALGWTTTALASPIQQTTNQDRIAAVEARLQALEYLRWTENHAINAVSQRLWDRYSGCYLQHRYDCYTQDLVLIPFLAVGKDEKGYVHSAIADRYAYNATAHGVWYAQDNGDGDSWKVWVVIDEHQFTWTVWQSNGFIQGVY